MMWASGSTAEDVRRLCTRAREQKARAVCVPGSRIELAASLLEDCAVKTVALIGFPLGNNDADVKRFEIETAFDLGAQEVEMVLNAGHLRDGGSRQVFRELCDAAEAAEERPMCVVLEAALLTREQMIEAAHLVVDSGATAIATGTGYLGAATARHGADVELLRQAVSPGFVIKCTDILDQELALQLLGSEATRIGTTNFGLLTPAAGI